MEIENRSRNGNENLLFGTRSDSIMGCWVVDQMVLWSMLDWFVACGCLRSPVEARNIELLSRWSMDRKDFVRPMNAKD